MLKFQALASVIVSNQARKPSFETKRAKACCNPHPRITAAEINLGETAAFGWGGRGFTAVKPQIESAF